MLIPQPTKPHPFFPVHFPMFRGKPLPNPDLPFHKQCINA